MADISYVLNLLRTSRIPISTLISTLLMSGSSNPGDFLILDLISNARIILSSLYHCSETNFVTTQWAHTMSKIRYGSMVERLSRKENGWHLGALHMQTQQIGDFQINQIAEKIQTLAPKLWDLLYTLLGASDKSLELIDEGEEQVGNNTNTEEMEY